MWYIHSILLQQLFRRLYLFSEICFSQGCVIRHGIGWGVDRTKWFPLQWRHNERNGVSNHQLNCLFRHRSMKTSKLRATGLFAGNSPVTGEFPAKRDSNAENVSIWWRYHASFDFNMTFASQWRHTITNDSIVVPAACTGERHRNTKAPYYWLFLWANHQRLADFQPFHLRMHSFPDICYSIQFYFMMTSSNGNIFCVTRPLEGESSDHRCIPLTKASDA